MFPRLTWRWCGLGTWITKGKNWSYGSDTISWHYHLGPQLWFSHNLVHTPDQISKLDLGRSEFTVSHPKSVVLPLITWAVHFPPQTLPSPNWYLFPTIKPLEKLQSLLCDLHQSSTVSVRGNTLGELCPHLADWFTQESAKALESCICSGFARRHRDWEMKQ